MDEPAGDRSAGVQGLLEGFEDEAGLGGGRHPPADDPSGEGVDRERHVDEAFQVAT
jgi:hypothetical protein